MLFLLESAHQAPLLLLTSQLAGYVASGIITEQISCTSTAFHPGGLPSLKGGHISVSHLQQSLHSHTQKCQGSVRCPHLSCPHALLIHTRCSETPVLPLHTHGHCSAAVIGSLWPPLDTPRGWQVPQPRGVLPCSAHIGGAPRHEERTRGLQVKEAHPSAAFCWFPRGRYSQSEVTSGHCHSWDPQEQQMAFVLTQVRLPTPTQFACLQLICTLQTWTTLSEVKKQNKKK